MRFFKRIFFQLNRAPALTVHPSVRHAKGESAHEGETLKVAKIEGVARRVALAPSSRPHLTPALLTHSLSPPTLSTFQVDSMLVCSAE